MGDIYLNNADKEILTLALIDLKRAEVSPQIKDGYKRIINKLQTSHDRQMKKNKQYYANKLTAKE